MLTSDIISKNDIKFSSIPCLYGIIQVSLSRMTANNYISPLKLSYNTSFTLPKQRSRSVLQDGSGILGLFWKEENLCLITKKIR